MKSFFIALGRKLARTMLFIKAVTHRKDAYKWASGMMMHIYSDNRMMLALYIHRMRVAWGFVEKLKYHSVKPDYILGTTTAGIAPAASVAQILGKEMLINHNGKFYLYEKDLLDKRVFDFYWFKNIKIDAIITTCPLAIPYGVQYANKLKTGFAYIRKGPKDHGKGRQVEGNLKNGMKVVLMYTGTSEEDIIHARVTLKNILENEEGCEVVEVYGIDISNRVFHKEIQPEKLQGENVPVFEDLFSTGGSAANEVYQLRQAGAICDFCFSIFSYEFDVLKKQFSGENSIGSTDMKLSTPCTIDSLLTFSVLKKEMERRKFFTPKVREEMSQEIENFDKDYERFLALSH